MTALRQEEIGREALADALLADDEVALLRARTVHGRAADAELRALRDAAGLATLAFVAPLARMPAAVQARLQVMALGFGAGHIAAVPSRTRSSWRLAALAAAAGFAAAWLVLRPATPPAGNRLREFLLREPGSSVLAWRQGPSSSHGGVDGDVVWNGSRQEGWLRVAGLRSLDREQQYQLWIVDGERSGAPVDGGLFDLPGPGEHLVHVQPRLPIGRAAAFVVTVEPRGGVVVSAQQDVVAIASP